LAQGDTVIEAVRPMGCNIALDIAAFRGKNRNRDGIAGARQLQKIVGLLRQPAGIERENADRQALLRDEIEQYHVLGAKARGQHGWGVSLCRLAQKRRRLIEKGGHRIFTFLTGIYYILWRSRM